MLFRFAICVNVFILKYVCFFCFIHLYLLFKYGIPRESQLDTANCRRMVIIFMGIKLVYNHAAVCFVSEGCSSAACASLMC